MQLYYLVLLIFGAWQFPECGAACNEQNVGRVFCARFDHSVRQHQWATCLSSKDIKQLSGQTHGCKDKQATHCYYQCMLETGQCDGFLRDFCQYTISSECKCNPFIKPTQQLPASCNSPDGTNSCSSWYEHCLKQRYSHCIEKDKDDYGIAENLCQLSTNHASSSFSAKAEQWMVAAQKCMQMTLVPYIRPWKNASCATLKANAFEHTCYSNPGGLNKISYCHLSFTDQMKVFWTIKSGIASTFTPGLKGACDILLNCLERSPSSPENVELYENVKLFHLKVDILTNSEQYQEWNYGQTRDELLGYLTGRVVDEIASRQKWRMKGLAWFAFPAKTYLFDSYYFITILLVDRYTYEASNASIFASRPSQPVNVMSIALSEMVNEFKSGGFNTIETGTDKVAVSAMNHCTDWQCTRFSSRFEDSGFEDSGFEDSGFEASGSTLYVASTVLWLWLTLHVFGDIF